MTEKVKAAAGYLYNANYDEEILAEIGRCNDLCYEFNQLRPSDRDGQHNILRQIFGKMGEHVDVNPPFWCDYGYNTSVGDYFFANRYCQILGREGHIWRPRIHRSKLPLYHGGTCPGPGAAECGPGSGTAHYSGKQCVDRRRHDCPGRRIHRRQYSYRRWKRGNEEYPSQCGRSWGSLPRSARDHRRRQKAVSNLHGGSVNPDRVLVPLALFSASLMPQCVREGMPSSAERPLWRGARCPTGPCSRGAGWRRGRRPCRWGRRSRPASDADLWPR